MVWGDQHYPGGIPAWNDIQNDGNAGQSPQISIAEVPLTSSITFSANPKEGAEIFTTSINLSAGTQDSGNLAEGSTVYWKVSGISEHDLASGQLSGSGTITNGKLDLQHSLKKDSDTGESFEVSVFSDAEMTQQIGVNKSETVVETNQIVDGTINQNEIHVNGSSSILLGDPSNKVQLLATKHGWGSAWWKRSIDITRDWSKTFEIDAYNGSGASDGFTFAINGDPRGLEALGDGGQNLGFFGYDSKTGISSSYAVLFDMFTTQPDSLIGLEGSTSAIIPQGSISAPVSLANNTYNVQIEYSASQKILTTSLRGKSFSQSADLQALLPTHAYIGFKLPMAAAH